MRAAALVSVVGFLLAGCGGAEHQGGTQRSFDEAVQDGAPCQELFDIRNERDPKDPIIETMNDTLRSIGCYSASSTRTDR